MKEEIIEFSVAVLDKVWEKARQEDAPIYEGDKEADYFVRLSDVMEAINEALNEDQESDSMKKVCESIAAYRKWLREREVK